MKNLALCLLMHVFGKSTLLCRCPLNGNKTESETPITHVSVNYITQNGKANIAGNGTIEYKTRSEELERLRRLEAENRLLVDMVQMLRNRDRIVAKKR